MASARWGRYRRHRRQTHHFPYRQAAPEWLKIRHADTIEAALAGFTGTARQPRALAVRLPDGRVALSSA